MNLSRILLAAEIMVKAHGDQKRKYTNEPYAVHPLSVARMVAEHGGTEDMICAALLHDVVEDTSYRDRDVLNVFGANVCSLVMECTEISRPEDGNREARKAMDRAHFASASPEGQTIKLADLVDNSRTILLHDKDFAKVFFREKQALLAVMTRGDGRLYHQAMRAIEEFFANQEVKSPVAPAAKLGDQAPQQEAGLG
jgi:(p)ppGpp synthase/HD superfamily hydrolase